MGIITIDLSSGTQIKWPEKCAFCGAKPSDWAEANFSRVTALQYYVIALGWTTKTQMISYPVCQHHKRFCSFLSEPTKWTFTDTLLYLLFIPSGFAFPLLGIFIVLEEFAVLDLGSLGLILAFCVFVIAFIFLLMWKIFSLVYVPIKLMDFDEISIKLFCKDNRFLQDFITMNKDMIKS